MKEGRPLLPSICSFRRAQCGGHRPIQVADGQDGAGHPNWGKPTSACSYRTIPAAPLAITRGWPAAKHIGAAV